MMGPRGSHATSGQPTSTRSGTAARCPKAIPSAPLELALGESVALSNGGRVKPLGFLQ